MTAKIKLNAASGGGSFSLQAPSSSSNNRVFTIPDVADGTIATTATAGKILQVKNAIKTDTQSVTNGTFTDITGLSISMTPSSSSNKILFRGYVAVSGNENSTPTIKIFRDSTEIGKSTADSTAANNSTATGKFLNISSVTSTGRQLMRQLQFEVLDSPNTTSATTYKVQFAETHLYIYGSTTVYINRPYSGMGAEQHGVISSVTAMEVAA